MERKSFTTDHDDFNTQRLFSRAIRNHGPLTLQEENTLFKKVREGDPNALDRIVRAHSRYVISVAKQYMSHGINLMDLVQEGLLALVEAAKRFDETRGFKFLSYASHWVKQFLLRAVKLNASLGRSIYSLISETEMTIAETLSGDWGDRPDAQLMSREISSACFA